MNVCEIMTKDVECVFADQSLFEAARKMKDVDTGALPVVNHDGDVLGIITDRDIVVRAAAEGEDLKNTPVQNAMTEQLITCRPDCPIEAAADTMAERRIRRLVVTTEHNKHAIGIVSLGDIALNQRKVAGETLQEVSQPV